MSIHELEKRIDHAEQLIKHNNEAPTVPIYDPSNLPEDAVAGQIAVGTDNSFNWYDGTIWRTKAGIASTILGTLPQDGIDGQAVIGQTGIHWCMGGVWYTAAYGLSVLGILPQDVVPGQIAVGSDGSLHWYTGIEWEGFPL